MIKTIFKFSTPLQEKPIKSTLRPNTQVKCLILILMRKQLQVRTCCKKPDFLKCLKIVSSQVCRNLFLKIKKLGIPRIILY